MSHKGSWNRIKDYRAWNNSPIWDKKPTRIIDIIKEYPAETLAYEQGFDIEQYDLPLETHFKSIIEIPIDHGSKKMGLLHAHLNDSGSDIKPRVFLITNHQDKTTKLAVWMDEIQ